MIFRFLSLFGAFRHDSFGAFALLSAPHSQGPPPVHLKPEPVVGAFVALVLALLGLVVLLDQTFLNLLLFFSCLGCFFSFGRLFRFLDSDRLDIALELFLDCFFWVIGAIKKLDKLFG